MTTKTNELNYKLSDFKIGTLVTLKSGELSTLGSVYGFKLNNDGETIIKVKWTETHKTAVHPSNLKIER